MASNPYVNKISVNGNVVLDLTGDGVTSPDVRAGVRFHDKSGAQKVGAMAEQGAQTITPSLSPQTIAGNKYLTGEQTISAITAALLAQLDSDFTAENIAKDVNLFGLIGTHEGGGGGSGSGAPVSASPKDINFMDYDGTIVASWTLAELASATALPPNPTHAGLISQGWNWSLADLKATNRAVNVGQMYITDDGKTRLYIHIATLGRMNVPLCFSQTVANGVTIDWGDGSDTQTLAGTGKKNTSHMYADIGDYVITLDPAEGCVLGLGDGTSSYCVMGSTGYNGIAYTNMLQKAEIGKGMTSINNHAFYGCHSLTSITIPEGVTSFGGSVFYNCYSLAQIAIPDGVTNISPYVFQCCYSLASIAIPDSVTSISNYAFQYCYSLASITIPEGVTYLYAYAFQYCYSLASITIPDGVTSIDGSVFRDCRSLASIIIPDGVTSIGKETFRGCYSVAEYHLKPTTPPSLTTSSFTNISSDCIIYVPYSADHSILNAYQTATNWATHASKMQEEPQ